MAYFDESESVTYDWDDGGVYVLEREDPVEGGADGVSNRQGKELALRTRNLHDRLEKLGEDVDVKDVAVLRSAKEYTDGKETVILSQVDLKDEANLNTAKEYADRIVAALVNGSTEQLDTLKELADALGNDPNFSATVMQKIGEKVSTETFNEKMDKKADKAAVEIKDFQNIPDDTVLFGTEIDALNKPHDAPYFYGINLKFHREPYLHKTYFAVDLGADRVFFRRKQEGKWGNVIELYHTGNLLPATQTTTGLMSAADKKKLDGLNENNNFRIVAWGTVDANGNGDWSDNIKIQTLQGGPMYKITHNLGTTRYLVHATVVAGYDHAIGYATITGKDANKFYLNTAQGLTEIALGFNFQVYQY